jgi:adenylate cyclase
MIVLPFTSDHPEPAAAGKLARIISDDLINSLSSVPSFRVISRSTSSQYDLRMTDVAALAAELGVQYVVEGSVRFDGEKARINVALIDARTRLHVWSERYERDETNRLAVQDEITRGVARQLHVKLMEVRGRGEGSTNPTLNEQLGMAWSALNRYAFGNGGAEGERLFRDVLRDDPTNASALTGLGAFKASSAVKLSLKNEREPLLAEARGYLQQAVQQNPNASLPYYFLGFAATARGDPDEAMAQYAKCLELNPSHAPAYGQISFILLQNGRLREALEHVMYAIRLSPKDHYMGLWSAFAGIAHMELGEDRQAEDWFSQSVRLSPRLVFGRAAAAAFYAHKGDKEATRIHAAELARLAPGQTYASVVRRYTGLSKNNEHAAKRLIAGLRLVFPTPEQ